jgi:hypothetical protein
MDERQTATIEAVGVEWRARSDEFLVGYVARQHEPGFHTPAIVEMQRQMAVAIREFNAESGKHPRTMIRLTGWIIALTVVLGLIAGLQLWAMWKGAA